LTPNDVTIKQMVSNDMSQNLSPGIAPSSGRPPRDRVGRCLTAVTVSAKESWLAQVWTVRGVGHALQARQPRRDARTSRRRNPLDGRQPATRRSSGLSALLVDDAELGAPALVEPRKAEWKEAYNDDGFATPLISPSRPAVSSPSHAARSNLRSLDGRLEDVLGHPRAEVSRSLDRARSHQLVE
jgi:hypothetical protein